MTMNEVTVFVYLTFFIGIFGMTFAFMWKMMGSTLAEFDKQKKESYNIHPEMDDVKDGTELLVFKPSPDDEED